MAKWARKEIQDRALSELTQAAADGIRYMELAKKIHAAAPETPFNSIVGALHDLSLKNPEIARPSRGLWVLKKHWEKASSDPSKHDPVLGIDQTLAEKTAKISEESYYGPFADWLLGQDQAIEAMVVGGSTFKSKWATPDVIGTYKPKKSDPVPFPIEFSIGRNQNRWQPIDYSVRTGLCLSIVLP